MTEFKRVQSVQTQNLHNMTIGGNTAGAGAAVSSGTLTLAGGNNITLSQNGNAVTISAPNLGAGGGVNIAASNTTYTSGTVVFSGSNGVTVKSGTGQAVIIDPGAKLTRSFYSPQNETPLIAGQQGQSTLHMQPMQDVPTIQHDRIAFPVVYTGATNSTGSHTLSIDIALYTLNGSTFSLLTSYNGNAAISHNGTNSTAANNELKYVTIGATGTITEGDYYAAIITRTASAGANATISQMLASQVNSNLAGYWGVAVTNSNQLMRGLGVYSAQTAAFPNAISVSELRGTASIVLRAPAFTFLSQTF